MSDSCSAAPRYIPVDRKQFRLEPLDVERLIDEDHPARKIWRVVEQLDLSGFGAAVRAVEGVRGRPSHSPQVLVAVWIYAIAKGLHSAREVERQMHYEPGLRWLTGLNVINHHSLSDFRVGNGEALRELFEQVLAKLTLKGLITLERVAVDGTKIRAEAGKKSFGKRAKIEAHLKLAREQRLEEALEEIERLRAAKKEDKDKESQASTSDPSAAFIWKHDGGLAPACNVEVTADSVRGLIADILGADVQPAEDVPTGAGVERGCEGGRETSVDSPSARAGDSLFLGPLALAQSAAANHSYFQPIPRPKSFTASTPRTP